MWIDRLTTQLGYRLFLQNPGARAWIQRMLFPDRDETVRLIGADVRINSQREFGYWRASRLQQASIVFRHEVAPMMAVSALVRDGTTFVDCGANVGLWTANLLRLGTLFPTLTVLAFEPNPNTFARLRRTVGDSPSVDLQPVALSDVEGEATMSEGVVSGVSTIDTDTHGLGGAYGGRFVVPVHRLDRYLAGRRNLIIKIDVEDHELKVLRGAERAFAERRVDAVFVDGFKPSDEADISGFLRDAGFGLLNARTLLSFASGDTTILAVPAAPRRPRIAVSSTA